MESFLQRLPEIRGELALDVEAAFNGDPAARKPARKSLHVIPLYSQYRFIELLMSCFCKVFL